MIESTQDKQKEISFFDGHAAADSYDVFTPESNLRLIRTCTGLAKWKDGARVADLGCGSGVFTNLLRQQGRSEEHTSELQSRRDLVCRLLLEKKKKIKNHTTQ